MCLACELDALWYAEPLAAESAGTTAHADVAPGLAEAAETSGAAAGTVAARAAASARAFPAPLRNEGDVPPLRPAKPRPRFLCEEAE